MNSRRTFLATIGSTAILGAALAGSALAAPGARNPGPKAEIGKPAPDFALKDVAGKEYRLSDYKGRIVVLEWINPQCPICRGCFKRGEVAEMSRQLKALDATVVHLAINSTSTLGPKDSAAYLKEFKVNIPGLDDSEGTVGHLYGAKTTPHLFVVDQQGILRYRGAIDDARLNPKAEQRTLFAVNAVRQILAGETVAPDTTQSYGCSVKYKKTKKSTSGL